jgi:hypothetical protein
MHNGLIQLNNIKSTFSIGFKTKLACLGMGNVDMTILCKGLNGHVVMKRDQWGMQYQSTQYRIVPISMYTQRNKTEVWLAQST